MSKSNNHKTNKQVVRARLEEMDDLAPRKMLGKLARMNYGNGPGRKSHQQHITELLDDAKQEEEFLNQEVTQ